MPWLKSGQSRLLYEVLLQQVLPWRIYPPSQAPGRGNYKFMLTAFCLVHICLDYFDLELRQIKKRSNAKTELIAKPLAMTMDGTVASPERSYLHGQEWSAGIDEDRPSHTDPKIRSSVTERTGGNPSEWLRRSRAKANGAWCSRFQ